MSPSTVGRGDATYWLAGVVRVLQRNMRTKRGSHGANGQGTPECSRRRTRRLRGTAPAARFTPFLQSLALRRGRMWLRRSCWYAPKTLAHRSPCIFFALDHSPESRMILILQTIPILLHRFRWRIVEVLPLLENRYQVAPICTGLRGSVETNFLVTRSNFSYHFPRNFIRSPRSLLFLSNWTPGILTSITSLHGAYWSRGWYVRRRPCNKIHHWSRFCCDSFFTWIVLRSFRHCIRAHCRTEMADIEQAQQMIPLITCENFLWLECQRVGFWCRCIWFGFWCPD